MMRVPFQGDGRALRENGDAALTLEVIRVHRAFGDDLAVAEATALTQEPFDERGLAVCLTLAMMAMFRTCARCGESGEVIERAWARRCI